MEDNVKKYLDKVVDQMVSETEISDTKIHHYLYIVAPFYDAVFTEDAFIEMKELLQHLKWFPAGKLSHHFSLHVKNIYGLSKKEIPYALGKYIDAILLKING
jgi:hypothetical protein